MKNFPHNYFLLESAIMLPRNYAENRHNLFAGKVSFKYAGLFHKKSQSNPDFKKIIWSPEIRTGLPEEN